MEFSPLTTHALPCSGCRRLASHLSSLLPRNPICILDPVEALALVKRFLSALQSPHTGCAPVKKINHQGLGI